MIKLLKNANVYAPEKLGKKDILIEGEKILLMQDSIEGYEGLPGVETYDLEGKIVVPAYIDMHVHITGGGGEQGPASRVPESQLSEFFKNGITTVVGLLGTDGVTRSVENLVAKARALTEEGMTVYTLTSSYGYPPTTLTGSVERDIILVPPMIGVKVAVSDHRSSNPGGEELIALATAARRAGLLSNTPGLVTMHMGDGEGRLDPVVGRDKEIIRLIQILSRRSKNNPCLVGEPGVGKTAIVEGLAQKIVNGMVPDSVKDKRVVVLDMSGMVAGSKYRGEFEERIRNVIDEVRANKGILLFIDELHTIIGAGGAEGALDASNILKPSLSRGEIQLIGATTQEEYRRYIEKDAALERRFQPVTVEEPTEQETLEILKGLRPYYEKHHGVTIEDEALEAAVKMSVRYINDRFLPDKAIDIIDEAASKVQLGGYRSVPEIDQFEAEIREILQQKELAIKKADLSMAKELQQRQNEIEEQIQSCKAKEERRNKRKHLTVTENSVADIVSDWTKIPVKKLTDGETKRLAALEKELHKRVIGQDEAVKAVAQAVKRGRVGLKDPHRPIGSFLFLGPTGVGKTELSKALAEAVFGSDQAMIRVDMSEYMEKHSVAKMIGSPPGYVGHDDGGQLSEQVRRHPYSVVLFDEIEKAHPDVFNILLQVLDDGHITDSQGRKVDFSNTVIIMTSNAGAQSIIDPKKLGFNTKEDAAGDYKRMKNNVMNEIKFIFRPEFLNRIDEILVFHPLTTEQMQKIVGLMCKELVKRAKEQLGIHLTIRDSVKKHIVETGMDKKYGARPLRRAVQNQLEDKLAEAILSGEIGRDMDVVAGMSKKEIKFT